MADTSTITLRYQQLRHLGDPPDVFQPVLIGEAQIRVQPGPDIVPVKNTTNRPCLCNTRSTAPAMVDFPDPDRPPEPHDQPALAQRRFLFSASEKAVEFRMNVHGGGGWKSGVPRHPDLITPPGLTLRPDQSPFPIVKHSNPST